MKPFDLEQALAGKPCITRDGRKAFVVGVYPEHVKSDHPIVGYVEDFKTAYSESWTTEGRTINSKIERHGDIVGMYEEPEPDYSFKYMHKFVKLRSGDKAYITGFYPNNEYPYAGVIFRDNEEITMSFNSAGEAYKRLDLSIVGLWEDSI